MPGELVPLADGGTSANNCIIQYLSSANTQSSSFVGDFFRSPALYFAGTSENAVSLQDYLSRLSKDEMINLVVSVLPDTARLPNEQPDAFKTRVTNEITKIIPSVNDWDTASLEERWRSSGSVFFDPSAPNMSKLIDKLIPNTNQSSEEKKSIFKKIGFSFFKAQYPTATDDFLSVIADHFNQHLQYASGNIPRARLPFMTMLLNEQGKFSNGNYQIVITPYPDNNQFNVLIKSSVGFTIPLSNEEKTRLLREGKSLDEITNLEYRSLSTYESHLVIKNVAKPGEPDRYEAQHESTTFRNPALHHLLFNEPYANRDYGLQRKLLMQMKQSDPDPQLNAYIKTFDQAVIKNVEISTDCSHMDLSGLNLSGLDLRGKNFTGANLEGANLEGANLEGANLTNANLTDTKLSGAICPTDLPHNFEFQYRGAMIRLDDLPSVINSVRDQHYCSTGEVLPNINGIFGLLQFIQKHPTDDFAKKLDHALSLYAIRLTASTPSSGTTSSGLTTDELDSWKTQFAKGRGLSEMALTPVMQNMHVTMPSGTTQTTHLAGKRAGDNYTVPFDLFGKTTHIINIAKTLDELSRTEDRNSRVDRYDFARAIADIAKMKETIDCIQMPLAAGRGREHFLHLQIFKKENGSIGARVIDSTTNHPLAKIPVDFVQSVLAENAEQLQKILGTSSRKVSPVTVVRTNEQMRPLDKKCPLYVAKGIQATTEKALQEGNVNFLWSDDKVKEAIGHQHHLVSKTEPLGVLFQLANINLPSATVQPKSKSSGKFSQSSLIEGYDTTDFDAIRKESRETATQVHGSAYNQINTLLADLDTEKLKNAVTDALKSYIQNNTKGSMLLTFFRQASNAGKDYALDALTRIGKNPDEALNVAKEILHMGVKENGTFEIKNNSRVQHLLKALENQEIIPRDKNLSTTGVLGKTVSMSDIKTALSVSSHPTEPVVSTTPRTEGSSP